MSMRNKIEERIQKKKEEIRDLEKHIGEANAYLQAMQDTLRMMPREGVDAGSVERFLKPGSAVAKTLAMIKKAKRPMDLSEILHGLGRPDNKKNRATLAGSLGWYVRKREIFTRPLPNTFGLMSMEATVDDQLPDDFGSMDDNSDADEEKDEEEEQE